MSDEKKPILILEAHIKDDQCRYKFLQNEGIRKGDKIDVDANAIVHTDLKEAFAQLCVFLAVIDDAFKNAGVEFDTIESVKAHELTFSYHVTGIKIKGEGDDATVSIIGSKHVSSCHGRLELTTPKVPVDANSSFKWAEELREAVERVCEEVVAYSEGKFDLQLTEEQYAERAKKNPRQKKLQFVPVIPEDTTEDGETNSTESQSSPGAGNGDIPDDFKGAEL